jgi:hypothetical protein
MSDQLQQADTVYSCLFFLQTLVLSILSEILSVLLWLFDAFWPKISPFEER